MERVLVTGANGFVGGHLAQELINQNYEVTGLVFDATQQGNLPSSVKKLEVDLTKKNHLKVIDFRSIDYVIHLAGLANVGKSFGDPEGYMKANVGMEINLFDEALAQNTHPRFLIISSGSLYDPLASLPITEGSRVAPNSPYAESKLAQETEAQNYTSRGLESVIVRPFNHIGPGQGLGFIVPDLVKQVVDFKTGATQNIQVGNLDTSRDYTDVRDIVKAYVSLMVKGRSGEIYNVCSGKAVSGRELLGKIIDIVGVDPEIVVDQSRIRPTDTPLIYGNPAKLTKEAGWQPVISLDQTLNDVVNEWLAKA